MGSKKRLLIPLSLVQKKNMKEDGSFVILKQRSGQQFADPYYVFFPEANHISSNEAQIL
jgi:hypothetical protein